MKETVRDYVLKTLREMNYNVADVTDDTVLGPAGADLSSLALAELGVRVEDEFGVQFNEEEYEELAGLSIGEFCEVVAGRLGLAKTVGD
jgi:acyl carrier protein